MTATDIHTTKQTELRSLMQEHSLTYQQVAELAGVSVKLVERWLADPAAKSNSPIRRPYLDLIKLRLKGR